MSSPQGGLSVVDDEDPWGGAWSGHSRMRASPASRRDRMRSRHAALSEAIRRRRERASRARSERIDHGQEEVHHRVAALGRDLRERPPDPLRLQPRQPQRQLAPRLRDVEQDAWRRSVGAPGANYDDPILRFKTP